MLSWDEYDSEESIPTAVKTNIYATQIEPTAAPAVAEPAPVYADNAA